MWAIGSVSGPIVGGAFAQNGKCTSFCLLGLSDGYSDMALDLLDQSTNRRRGIRNGHTLPQTTPYPSAVIRRATTAS